MVKKNKHRVLKQVPSAVKDQRNCSVSFKQRFVNTQVALFVALILFAFSLNALEMNWGLTGYVTWQPDAIEGEITVNHLPLLFKQWRHKYPRGHFLINSIFYKPLLEKWAKEPVTFSNSDGKQIQAVITAERARLLASISRWITATMSIGAVIAVFVLTKFLFGDYLAGWFAALALSTTCLFLFFSGIGHIDVPFTFWFACASVFVLKAAFEHGWHHYILAALCAGYALSTKEGYFGYIPGLAVVYCIVRIVDQYKQTKDLKKAFLSILSLRVLVAIVVFMLLFLIMNGFLNCLNEISGRMEYWKNDETFQHKRPQSLLLRQSGIGLYKGLGWPLLLLFIIGIAYLGRKHPVTLVFVLIPVLVFYLVTVMRIRFVADRFFIPAYVCFAVAIGKTLADWIRFKKIPIAVRYGTVVVLLGLNLLFCIGLKLEMKNDSRVQAERWFDRQVNKKALIGSGMKRWYAPRLKYHGYRLIDGWHSEGIQTSTGLVKIDPDYLIESNMFPCSSNYKNDLEFKKQLYDGKTGYTQVATFEATYFPHHISIFSIACWPYEKPTMWISPTVDIFKKDNSASINSR